MTMFVSKRIAEFAAALRFSDLSAGAVTPAKRLLVDSIGCALGGPRSADSRVMSGPPAGRGGRPDSTGAGRGPAGEWRGRGAPRRAWVHRRRRLELHSRRRMAC